MSTSFIKSCISGIRLHKLAYEVGKPLYLLMNMQRGTHRGVPFISTSAVYGLTHHLYGVVPRDLCVVAVDVPISHVRVGPQEQQVLLRQTAEVLVRLEVPFLVDDLARVVGVFPHETEFVPIVVKGVPFHLQLDGLERPVGVRPRPPHIVSRQRVVIAPLERHIRNRDGPREMAKWGEERGVIVLFRCIFAESLVSLVRVFPVQPGADRPPEELHAFFLREGLLRCLRRHRVYI
eukprot:jgi/Mesvir1/38/Mv25779-RA.1